MVRIIAIEIVVGAGLVLLWYWWFHRSNRRKSVQVLQRIKTAFAGHAQIVAVRWTASSRFSVKLRVLSTLFQHASVLVRLHPRELPLNWVWSRLRKQQETLVFEADLECPPAFDLEVHNHRWCGRTRRFPRKHKRILLEHCGPFVLTTRNDWQREITTMMTALVASRDCDFLTVNFRRSSPHFSATVPLDSLSPESQCEAQLFDVLRELASCASASRF
ncbi:MAG: hypothetical protein ACR2IF_16215 [Terriglobales bacterium]